MDNEQTHLLKKELVRYAQEFPFWNAQKGKKTNGQFNSSRMDYIESVTGEKTRQVSV